MADNLTAYEEKAMIGGCLSKPSPYAAKDTNAPLEATALNATVNAPLRDITPKKARSTQLATKSDVVRTCHVRIETFSTPTETCSAIRGCIDANPGSLVKNAAESTSGKRMVSFVQKDTHEKPMLADAQSAFESIKRNGMQSTRTLKTLRLLSDIMTSKPRGLINTIPSASGVGVSKILNEGANTGEHTIFATANECSNIRASGDSQTLNAQMKSDALLQAAAMLERKARRVRTRRLSGKPLLQSSGASALHVGRTASSRRITSSRSREAAAITLSTSRGFASRVTLASARAWLPDYSIPSSTVCTSSRSFVENKSEESHV
jgi:hypothetical protein